LHLRAAPILAAASLIAFLIPGPVAAHAALDVPTPADGTTVQGTPTEVAGTFTQDLETDGSSIQLRNEAGDVVASGVLDPTDARRMVITALPELEPGDYEVRWVTLSAEDGELERDTWSFTVVAPASSATATPTVAPTDAATAPPTPTPSIDGREVDPAAADVVVPIVAGLAIVLIVAGLLLRRRGRAGPSGRSGPSA